jgi:TRAP-type C4-dicarboxylate transport system permease small subunit
VFLAAGITLEVGRHVSVDVLRGRLSGPLERLLFAIIDLVGLVFSAGATIIALNLTLLVKGTGQISPTLGVPTYLLYAAPVVGFASLAFRYLLRLLSVRDARRWPVVPAWLGNRDES